MEVETGKLALSVWSWQVSPMSLKSPAIHSLSAYNCVFQIISDRNFKKAGMGAGASRHALAAASQSASFRLDICMCGVGWGGCSMDWISATWACV